MPNQTSVEWLIDQVEDFIGLIPVDIIEQAKQMHKEEIVNAWIATDNELQRLSAEQYYQETYGGEDA